MLLTFYNETYLVKNTFVSLIFSNRTRLLSVGDSIPYLYGNYSLTIFIITFFDKKSIFLIIILGKIMENALSFVLRYEIIKTFVAENKR